MLGYAAVYGYCDWSVVIPLYLTTVQWTIISDTIYSHQVLVTLLPACILVLHIHAFFNLIVRIACLKQVYNEAVKTILSIYLSIYQFVNQ